MLLAVRLEKVIGESKSRLQFVFRFFSQRLLYVVTFCTLRQPLINVKDKDETANSMQNHVLRLLGHYIGQTGRNLNKRLTERKRATGNGDLINNIAEHHLQTNHRNDWDSAECVIYGTDYYQRLTLEIWFTNLEETPLNRYQHLPAPYKRLVDDIKTDNLTNKGLTRTTIDRSKSTTCFRANNMVSYQRQKYHPLTI